MRVVLILSVFLFLSVPADASFEALYELLKNTIFGLVHVSASALENVLRHFKGFPVLGLMADGGTAVINNTASLAMNILEGSDRMLLPIVHGVHAIIELPFKTRLLTPLRCMLEGIINMSGTMENATFANLVTMFDGAYKETQGRIVANNADQQDIVADDTNVLTLVKLLNATVYSTMQSLLVPLSAGGIRNTSGRGDVLFLEASQNVTVAISSLNEIQSGLSDGPTAASDSAGSLISALNSFQLLLDESSDFDGISSSAADVIYKSVLVLVQFSNAGVSSDDLGRFFVNIIGAIVGAVDGGILKLSSAGASSTTSISTYLNTALAPLSITVTVTVEEIVSSQEVA